MGGSVIWQDIARVGGTVFSRAAGGWKYSPRVQCPAILHDQPLNDVFILLYIQFEQFLYFKLMIIISIFITLLWFRIHNWVIVLAKWSTYIVISTVKGCNTTTFLCFFSPLIPFSYFRHGKVASQVTINIITIVSYLHFSFSRMRLL